MNKELLWKFKDHVAFLTIHREAARNSLNENVLKGILAGLDKAIKDDAVRVVCMQGAGTRAFCAGGDLAGVQDAITSQKLFASVLKTMHSYPKPLVALVQGVALGGGFGLALSCDLIIASEGSQFGTPEVNVGLYPLMISPLIFKHLAPKLASEMILTGKKLKAAEALELGIVNRVFSEAEFDKGVSQFLAEISTKSPKVLSFGKKAVLESHSMDFYAGVDFLCGSFGELLKMPDAQEGIMAFLEKRKPNFE